MILKLCFTLPVYISKHRKKFQFKGLSDPLKLEKGTHSLMTSQQVLDSTEGKPHLTFYNNLLFFFFWKFNYRPKFHDL